MYATCLGVSPERCFGALSAKASRPGAGKSKEEERKEGARAAHRAGRGAGGEGAGRLHCPDNIHSAGRLSSAAVPGPARHALCGAMNLNGDGSFAMSVITSIREGAFAASASRRALRNPAASVTRQDRTPKALA